MTSKSEGAANLLEDLRERRFVHFHKLLSQVSLGNSKVHVDQSPRAC
jgi:hypothetical protein